MELVEGREKKGDVISVMTREITISNPNFDKNKNEILLRASIKTYVLTGRNVGNYLL